MSLYSNKYFDIVFVFLLSLSMSLLYIYTNDGGYGLISPFPLSDAAIYLHRSWYSAFIDENGGFLGNIVVFSPYSILISIAYKIFGSHYLVPLISNSLLFALTATFISLFTKTLFNSRLTSILSGFIFSFSGIFLFYAGLTLKTNLVVMLLSASFYFIFLYYKDKKIIYIAPSMILLSLSAFDRYHLFGVLIVFLLFQLFEFYSDSNIKRFQRLISIVSASVIIIILSPWNTNKVNQDFFSPVGFNYYTGNSSEAWGGYVEHKKLDNNLVGHFQGLKKYTDDLSGKNLNRNEIDDYWLDRSLNFIKNNPYDYVVLQFKKVSLLFSQYGQGQPEEYRAWRWKRPILSIAIFDHGLIVSLGLIGMFFYIRKRRLLSFDKFYFASLIVTTIVMTLFFVQERYRVTLCLFFIPFAAYSISSIVVNEKHRLPIIAGGLFVFLLTVSLNFNIRSGPGFTDDINKYTGSIIKHRLPKEQSVYQNKILAVENNDYNAWLVLANQYHRLSFESDSIEFINKAKNINHTNPDLYFVLHKQLINNDEKLKNLLVEVRTLYQVSKGTQYEDEFAVLIKLIQRDLHD